MTVATRGNVHRSVANPCFTGPATKARSTLANASASSRGFRPARPAAFKPVWPSAIQAWCQWFAAALVTPNARATAACDSPRANRRAASNRRASNAAKSLRDPRLGVGMNQHAMVPVKSTNLFGETH